jgi:hypothetical protein
MSIHARVAPGPKRCASRPSVFTISTRYGRSGSSRFARAGAALAAVVATGPVFLYHNTFVADAPSVDGIALLEPGTVAFVKARNNVIAGTRHALFSVNAVPWDADADNLHATSALPLIHWLGTPYASLDAFRMATGQERAGFSGSPQLANPGGGDFSPAPGSPLIDRGLPIPGVNDLYTGRAPDVGAIERGERADVTGSTRRR